MTFEKKRASTKQEIPTSSMPDIIFMLLLFFMVTTTLREVEVSRPSGWRRFPWAGCSITRLRLFSAQSTPEC